MNEIAKDHGWRQPLRLRVAARLHDMSLRQRFLVAPLLGLLLIGALTAGFSFEYRHENALLRRIAETDLVAYDHYADLALNLSEQHLALRDLLHSKEQLDEAALYDRAKQRLNQVHAAVQGMEGFLSSTTGLGNVVALRREELRQAMQEYRQSVIAAVGLATIASSRMASQFARADERYSAMSKLFEQCLDDEREHLIEEIKAHVRRSDTMAGLLAMAGMSMAAVLLLLSFGLSRLLRRAVEQQVEALVELGAQAGTRLAVSGKNEIGRIAATIVAFQGTLLRLRENESALRTARDELESRVRERTHDLEHANASLQTEVDMRLAAEQRLLIYAEIVAGTSDGIVIATADREVVDVNAAYLQMSGCQRDEILGTTLLGHAVQPTGAQPASAWQELVQQTGRWKGELLLSRVGEEAVPCLASINTVTSADARAESRQHLVGICHDISELRRQQVLLEHQATHDALTGLPNRSLLLDRVGWSISRCARDNLSLAIMFIDLDKFKEINDTLGHSVGDELLIAISKRLTACVRECDTTARLGGDEFVILVDQLDDERAVTRLAQRVVDALAASILLAGEERMVTCSVGISTYPEDGMDAEDLMKHADIAMYRAKESGRNNFQFYKSEMQARMGERLTLERQLHRALERDEFVLHFQPQLDLRTGKIIGLEALVRWQSPEFGLVPPARFIPLAEESGLINAIGEWVLNKTCICIGSWIRQGLAVVPVGVNVSASQFAQQRIDLLVQQALKAAGVEPRYLELELTESLSMADPDASISMMQRLKAIGISLSIDDFGTGYSNLGYLKRFPVDKLKIDQSFVRGLTKGPEERAICSAVIGLAHALGVRAIAEGVETESQLQLLSMLGCDEMQGWYFSRAVPEDQIVEMLTSGTGLDLEKLSRSPYRRTVLFLDDDPRIQAGLRRSLDDEALELLLAGSADDAYELLAKHEVGIVISDYRMPKENGIEFLARVRKMYPRAVRILLTGDDSPATMSDAINQGEVFRFLTKPWTQQQMLETLRDGFRRYEGGVDGATDG